jgi:uroporphyrinogen-III synthase
VAQFMQLRPPGIGWPPRLPAAATGPGTSAALRAAGVPAGVLLEPHGDVFDSETLWRQQLQTRDWQRQRVLVVRGDDGRDWLADQLRGRGAAVEFLAAYRRCPPQLDAAAQAVLHAALAQPQQHLWCISSSQAAAHLAALAPQADWRASAACAPHARIAAALQRLGFGQVRLAAADAAALAALVRDLIREGRPLQF